MAVPEQTWRGRALTGRASVAGALGANRYLRALIHGRALLGAVLLLTVLVVGLLGPLVVPGDPNLQTADSLRPPSAGHLMGTDELGRDIMPRVISGIRIDLALAFVVVPIGAALGTIVGLLASARRFIDTALQRLFDVMFAFPGFILAVLIVSIVGPGVLAIAVTIVIFSVPEYGRQVRNLVISIREREFVLASQVVGASTTRILFRHILPNIMDILIVQLALSMSTAVFVEGGLSFVGLGIQSPQASLGSVLNRALIYITSDPSYVLAPIIPISLLVLGFTLIGDGLNRSVLRDQ